VGVAQLRRAMMRSGARGRSSQLLVNSRNTKPDFVP